MENFKKCNVDNILLCVNSVSLILTELASKEWEDPTKFRKIFNISLDIETRLYPPKTKRKRKFQHISSDSNIKPLPSIKEEGFHLLRRFIYLNKNLCYFYNRIRYSKDDFEKILNLQNNCRLIISEIIEILGGFIDDKN